MSAPSEPRRRAGLSKSRLISLLVLLALAAVLVGTQTWVRASLPDSGVQQQALEVPGTAASPAWTALAIAAAAAAVASAVAKRVMRLISLVLAALLFAALSALALVVTGDPAAAASSKVAESIGLQGTHTGAAAALTAWPWVGAVLGAVSAVLAGYAAWASLGWDSTARYSRTRGSSAGGSAQARSIDAWDDLTAGEDPTHS